MNPIFPKYPVYTEHPANAGLDFSFHGGITQSVLRNYLSRAQNCTLFENGFTDTTEDLRMLFHTGAKLICRAATPWTMGDFENDDFAKMKYYIDLAHRADPELLFENCIFETVFTSVESICIPARVFEAFSLPAQERNFRYEDMLFPDGRFVDYWGPGGSVPDITRLETQLWFYHRATLFIDLGFECLHLGQVMLMGKSDVGFTVFDRVIRMARDYAKTNARRGWLLVNAHIYDDRVGESEKLMCDFHVSPTRGMPPEGSVPHPPLESAPQEINLYAGHLDAIYMNSVGGITPSGWRVSSLPYIVELDNAGGYDKTWLDIPYRPKPHEWFLGGWWGFDEISWFATQPDGYRRKWLSHAWDWVLHIDGYGYCQMPGRRSSALRGGDDLMTITQGRYRANSREHLPEGFDDEEHIRSIWVKDWQSRQ